MTISIIEGEGLIEAPRIWLLQFTQYRPDLDNWERVSTWFTSWESMMGHVEKVKNRPGIHAKNFHTIEYERKFVTPIPLAPKNTRRIKREQPANEV